MDFSIELLEKQNLIPKESYDKIVTRLPEYIRGSEMVGHSTSQTSYSLQTMTMISDSPLSRMKQCLAQIDKRMSALREHYFKNEELKLNLEDLKLKTDKYSMLEFSSKHSTIQETTKYMVHAFRQIGHFQDVYDAIKKSNDIPDNWTEADYEKQELENMIRASYRLGIQELTQTGRVGKSSVEYWEQLGIHPQVGEIECRMYMQEMTDIIMKQGVITIVDMYNFLDDMLKKHYDDHKNAIKRMGLDGLTSELFVINGDTKPR